MLAFSLKFQLKLILYRTWLTKKDVDSIFTKNFMNQKNDFPLNVKYFDRFCMSRFKNGSIVFFFLWLNWNDFYLSALTGWLVDISISEKKDQFNTFLTFNTKHIHIIDSWTEPTKTKTFTNSVPNNRVSVYVLVRWCMTPCWTVIFKLHTFPYIFHSYRLTNRRKREKWFAKFFVSVLPSSIQILIRPPKCRWIVVCDCV